MATPNLGLPNTLAIGTDVSPSVDNRLHNIVDTQPFGALSAIGVGIVENVDGTSLQVEEGSGLFVAVSPGEAIVQSAARAGRASHAVWGRSQGEPALPVEPNATQYICARLVSATNKGNPDSEEGTALLDIVALDTDSAPGTLWLATAVTGEASVISVVPSNLYIKPDEALKKLLQLFAYVDYDPETLTKFGTVADRLFTLEGRGGTDDSEGDGDGNNGGGSGDNSGLQSQINTLRAALAQLRAEFDAFRLKQGDDSVVGVSETPSSLIVNQGKMMGAIVNLDPTSAPHFIAGIDMPDATGDAQRWNGISAPTIRIGGNARYDERSGIISGDEEESQ